MQLPVAAVILCCAVYRWMHCVYRKKLKPCNVHGHKIMQVHVPQHDALTRVFSVDETEAQLENLNGVDLFDFAMQPNRSVVQLYACLRQVWEALRHMHAHDAVHCDVKPENICVVAGGNAKLFDYGAVRFEGEQVVECTRGYMDMRQWKSKDEPPQAHRDMDTRAFRVTCISTLFCLNGPLTLETPNINVWIEQFVLKSLLSPDDLDQAYESAKTLAQARYAVNHGLTQVEDGKYNSKLLPSITNAVLAPLGLSFERVHGFFHLPEVHLGLWLDYSSEKCRRHGLPGLTSKPGSRCASTEPPAAKRRRK